MLLNVILTLKESFVNCPPVGKVDFMELYPMTFEEFLLAADSRHTLDHLPAASFDAHIPAAVHNHLWDMLKIYFVTGGMPEVVEVVLESKTAGSFATPEKLERARKIQCAIVTSYESDIAKHAGKLNATHIQALYRNIPSQIAAVHDASMRRFQFGAVMSGKKGFAVWEGPLQWLKNAGIVHQIKIANKPDFPLEHYTKPNMFKLVPHDIGLLGCVLDLPPAVILQQDFGIAKGYFAEAYVAQCLVALAPPDKQEQLYCWHEGEAEIEFIRNSGFANTARCAKGFFAREPGIDVANAAIELPCVRAIFGVHRRRPQAVGSAAVARVSSLCIFGASGGAKIKNLLHGGEAQVALGAKLGGLELSETVAAWCRKLEAQGVSFSCGVHEHILLYASLSCGGANEVAIVFPVFGGGYKERAVGSHAAR